MGLMLPQVSVDSYTQDSLCIWGSNAWFLLGNLLQLAVESFAGSVRTPKKLNQAMLMMDAAVLT